MAAAVAAIFTASSISFYEKPSTISSSCLHSLATTAVVPCNHLTTKLKSIKTLKLNPTRYPFSLTFRASVAFDNVDSVTDDDDDDIFDDDESDEEEIDGDEQKERQSDDSSRIYVGNLPYTMINSDLAQIFAEAGRVVSSQVVYDRVTDRSRGFAFVIMASVEEAKEAIRMFNGSQIGGRSIKVNFPESPRRGVGDDEREVISNIRNNNNNYQGFIDSPHKIYVGNLSWNLTSQGLKDAFGDQPGLLSAKVIYDRDAGRSRGFGFVTFSSANEAQSALDNMNGMEIEGRPLRVNMAGAERSNSPYISNRQTSFDSSQLLSSIGNSLSSGI
ncbi:33 kDa ribonucleoprotein, chloroplastic-like [Impatiens glandulifera]|uniref:33 kDa ribonucleoprotein, chloroplastic-like n=1 Tax=Impatiens glandulifera TaxID=253017 RepID=UPI001FB0D689|nr:33 kDa ribonucleoprotein, chloroplastic-like [Impatiens glandulifera]